MSFCTFVLCIWDNLISIVLYLEVCIIFSVISTSWQASLFHCWLPGQFIAAEAPGMKYPSIDVSEKVAIVFSKPRISYSSPLKKKYWLRLAKMQCTGLTSGRKVVLGDIKSPCGLIFCLHKPLAPKFSTRMHHPNFPPSIYLLFRALLGYMCFSVYLVTLSEGLFHEIGQSFSEPMVNSFESSSHNNLDKAVHKSTTNHAMNCFLLSDENMVPIIFVQYSYFFYIKRQRKVPIYFSRLAVILWLSLQLPLFQSEDSQFMQLPIYAIPNLCTEAISRLRSLFAFPELDPAKP